MKTVSGAEMDEALRGLGVQPGDLVMLHADIARVGLPEGALDRESVAGAYLAALRRAVGPEGTLAALACTESWVRHRTPFVYETSPSEQGVLAEHLRRQPGAVRSVHPLFSVCAQGPLAEALCANASPAAFGHDSPFARLLQLDALILCLGVDLRAMTFVHHVEQTMGVPYGYTKEWDAPAFRDGRPLPGRYFAFVRYLDCGVEYDFSRLQESLLAAGQARRVALGYSSAHAVRCRDVFDAAVQGLREDIFFLLRTPPKREPWKGPTPGCTTA